jgi:hypothetical protein
MKLSHYGILFSLMLACLSYGLVSGAEPVRFKPLSLVQAERLSVDLKQGMTLEDVEKLLGKPRRTTMKAQGQGYGSSADPTQGSLQWTYTWTNQSQADRSLQVVFASKSAGQWFVTSWEWGGY